MTLTDHIRSFLTQRPNGATTKEIKNHLNLIGYANRAESETKNISGICSYKCSNREWYKKDMGGYYKWSVYPI